MDAFCTGVPENHPALLFKLAEWLLTFQFLRPYYRQQCCFEADNLLMSCKVQGIQADHPLNPLARHLSHQPSKVVAPKLWIHLVVPLLKGCILTYPYMNPRKYIRNKGFYWATICEAMLWACQWFRLWPDIAIGGSSSYQLFYNTDRW